LERSVFASQNILKVVSGRISTCAEHGKALYKVAISVIVLVFLTQVAKFTKLLENIYRSVNIELVNESKTANAIMGVVLYR